MRAFESAVKPGFRRAQLIALLLVFFFGALFIWYALATHPAVRSRVQLLNTRRPMNVLVAVQGTPLDPGFVGFVAMVQPKSQVLNVVPISGLTEVVQGRQKEPLYQAFSDAGAPMAMRLASKATGMRIDHYFYLNADDLFLILNALYAHSPNWPKTQDPLTMLKTLGYPSGRIVPRQEMRLVREIVSRLPLINPIAASALLAIPKTSLTNLSSHQLFLLANYVRGDQLRRASVHQYSHNRRSHG